MINDSVLYEHVRGSIASRGWWMCCSVQAASSQEMLCCQYIMTADRTTTHTFKHAASYAQNTHMDAWDHSTGEQQMDQSMCGEEQWDAVMQKEGGGRQSTLRSAAHTEEDRGKNKRWDLTQTLCSPALCTRSSATQLRPQAKTEDHLDHLQHTGFLPTQSVSISKPDINLTSQKKKREVGPASYRMLPSRL